MLEEELPAADARRLAARVGDVLRDYGLSGASGWSISPSGVAHSGSGPGSRPPEQDDGFDRHTHDHLARDVQNTMGRIAQIQAAHERVREEDRRSRADALRR